VGQDVNRRRHVPKPLRRRRGAPSDIRPGCAAWVWSNTPPRRSAQIKSEDSQTVGILDVSPGAWGGRPWPTNLSGLRPRCAEQWRDVADRNGRATQRSGRAFVSPRTIGDRRQGLLKVSASAGGRLALATALARAGSRVCYATRPARPGKAPTFAVQTTARVWH